MEWRTAYQQKEFTSMDLNEYLWNHFVSSGRLERAQLESPPPNSGLRDYLRTVNKLFGESEARTVLMNMASLLIKTPNEVRTNSLRNKILDLAAQESFDGNLLREKISSKAVNQMLKKSKPDLGEIDIRMVAGGEIVWSLTTKLTVITMEFEKYSIANGLRYSVRLFPRYSIRNFSTCMAYFVTESVWGYGVGKWDLLFEEDDLKSALEILFKNIDCIQTGLIAYEKENR